jgi:hypothetical protein
MKNIIFNKNERFVGRNTSSHACQIFCSKSNCETMYHWVFLLEITVVKTMNNLNVCSAHSYLYPQSRFNTTGATSAAVTAYTSGAPEFTPVFSGIRVNRYLVLYVCFFDRYLSLCPFPFGHCVVCSLIYWFWLSLWSLQTHLKDDRQNIATLQILSVLAN